MRWRSLVRGEVIPLSGKIALWGLVGLVVGVRPLVMLVTANVCINAAHGLSTMATTRPIRLRRGASPDVFKVALRRAWTLEVGSMLGGLAALTMFGVFYTAVGRNEVAPLLLLMGWGLPARCIGPLKARAAVRQLGRLVRGWLGAALVGLVLLLDPSVRNVALALAGREWLTMLAFAMSPAHAPNPGSRENLRDYPPAWMEFFAATAALSMRRFFYQAGRSVLHLTLGPFGTVLARAGRRFGLAKRAGSFSFARIVAALAAAAGLVTMVLAACFVPGSGGLVLSALMLRLACLGVGGALWSWLSPQAALRDTDTTDDDDD